MTWPKPEKTTILSQGASRPALEAGDLRHLPVRLDLLRRMPLVVPPQVMAIVGAQHALSATGRTMGGAQETGHSAFAAMADTVARVRADPETGWKAADHCPEIGQSTESIRAGQMRLLGSRRVALTIRALGGVS